MDNGILVIGAHPDDETLGCGGLIKKNCDRVTVAILSRIDEMQKFYLACSILGVDKQRIHCEDYVDNEFPDALRSIIQSVEKWVEVIKPTTVLYHSSDVNQDHQVVNTAVKIACRRFYGNMIEYVVCPQIGFEPNIFFDIGEGMVTKTNAIKAYGNRTEARFPLDSGTSQEWAKHNGNLAGCVHAEGYKLIRGNMKCEY